MKLPNIFKRSRDVRDTDAFLAEYYGLRGAAGAATPEQTLSNLSVASACVRLRAEMLASVGLFLFRRTADGGRERADDNALYGVLHDLANPNMTAYEFREFLIRSLDCHGNAFARIERNARGQVVALWPEPWGNVGPERLPSGRLRYRVTDPRGGVMVLLQDEALHVRGPSRDGVIGLSPIAIARGAVGLALAQNEMASSFLQSAMRPSGLISYAEKLGAEKMAAAQAMMKDRFQGASAAGRVLLLDGGAKWEQLSFSPEDAEFLDSRKLANEDIARIFGMPPTTVGITDKSTYSNTEQEATALVRNALGPLAARVEQAMMRCLLSEAGRRTLYIEHDLTALLRGDVQARFEAYRIGREIGALSPNDIRRRENEPPIAGGDVYHQPANWVPLGTPAAATTGA